jgi:inorganic pyrophosphatase
VESPVKNTVLSSGGAMTNIYSICIEVPRGGLIKRNEHGDIDYISPMPCPFNYGSVLQIKGEDGDLQDAILLGKKKSVGFCGEYQLLGQVLFMDKGEEDHKWIFSEKNIIRLRDKVVLHAFFRIYAKIKKIRDLRETKKKTSFDGILYK